MTVKELIDVLIDMPEDAKVFIEDVLIGYTQHEIASIKQKTNGDVVLSTMAAYC